MLQIGLKLSYFGTRSESMFLRKTVGDKNQPLRIFSALLLLLLYLAGNVQVESFHQVFHSFEQALHSSDQEKDPCHRAIYHDSKQEGCDHKTHFTAVKKCPLCHIVPLSEKHIAVSHSFESISSLSDFENFSFSIPATELSGNLSARAPPMS
jgi:hypothetical protein